MQSGIHIGSNNRRRPTCRPTLLSRHCRTTLLSRLSKQTLRRRLGYSIWCRHRSAGLHGSRLGSVGLRGSRLGRVGLRGSRHRSAGLRGSRHRSVGLRIGLRVLACDMMVLGGEAYYPHAHLGKNFDTWRRRKLDEIWLYHFRGECTFDAISLLALSGAATKTWASLPVVEFLSASLRLLSDDRMAAEFGS